ncbi:MAG: hypothetical protein AB8U20_07120 [Rickettsiales endosymbiont of Dermacentor nuttalli]
MRFVTSICIIKFLSNVSKYRDVLALVGASHFKTEDLLKIKVYT